MKLLIRNVLMED